MKEVAIFDRNHPQFLEQACEESSQNPSRLITFRSSKLWVGAKEALDKQQIVQMYLSPIGSKGIVDYTATLKSVELNPRADDPKIQKLLNLGLPEMSREGLWEYQGNSVKTLYIISHCRKLANPFPITGLRKLSDDQPIDEGYKYGYVLVQPLNACENPEEVSSRENFYEGSVRQVTVNAYERNRAAREKCVSHYGTSCVVCGFNFEHTYGEIARGFIHVHHLVPLSKIKEGYGLDAIEGLRPVCPNCHAVLHMGDPLLGIDEVAEMIRSNR